jgi:CBS domain-containing protein
MKVKSILARQEGPLITCRPDHSLRDAAVLLRDKRIGAMPVTVDGARLVGVLSERDVVRGFAEHGEGLLALRVDDLMTRQVVVCRPTDDVTDAIRLMFQHKIRHLPVMDGTDVAGMISLRAAMEARLRARKWTGGQAPA